MKYLLILQSYPLYPSLHIQVKVFNPSIQEPPFLQGFETHSLMSEI